MGTFAARTGTYRPPRQIPAFDGFRGIGVCCVLFSHLPLVADAPLYNLLWHANQAPRIGLVLLDMFFSLSGFLITRLLLAERAAFGRISLKRFYTRRALRIFPVYYVAVIVTYAIFRFDDGALTSLLTYTFNIYHPFVETSNPMEHSWSLSVEEQFYFFWPLLISLLPLRWAPFVTRSVLPTIAIVSGLAMGMLVWTDDPMRSGDLVYMSPLTRMLSLSLGAWLALREFEGRPFRGRPCAALVVIAVMLLAADRFERVHGLIPTQGVYWTIALAGYAAISVSFTATIVFDEGRAGRWLRAVLSPKPLRAIGHISYALYVVHLPILFYFGLNDAVMDGKEAPAGMVALAIALSFALAIASYFWLEQPLLRLRPSTVARRQPSAEAPAIEVATTARSAS